ncbi:hypothetical protein MA16_Dca021612 [Dendrobium catenatum]|uniref:Integrase catalytic domain-containing protein n=1 Tax=Dendrobium catenatum TaxID=906689 RepID=A0A2I0W3N6_9ASPA|nr:hypothetical protein MA16_Dca021612 [Dendrobium catenatum]
MGPFPIATGQQKFIILAVDYFTKWVEAEPLEKITELNAKQFLWKNIICHFGIPVRVITDNGTQFTGKIFTSFVNIFIFNSSTQLSPILRLIGKQRLQIKQF